MTPVQLIEDLANDLERVLGHLIFPDGITGGTAKLNIYQFGIPVEKTNEDREKKFPYVLILPEAGKTEGGNLSQMVKVRILIGIFDRGMENQGKRHVLNVINDICERFLKNPNLEGKYYADEKITWLVCKKEEHPYHYGAIWLKFNAAAFRRESELA